MSTEEPAWKAELYDAVEEQFPLIRNAVTRDAIREFVTEHIQAAEERGRREAAREIRASIATWEGMSGYAAACMGGKSAAADLIDPDTP